MRIIVFSGSGGSGVSTLAAATAAAATDGGGRALAFGLGPGLGTVFGAPLGAEPTPVGGRLDACEGGHGGADEFRDWLEQVLGWRGMDVELAGDLAALPGMSHVGRLLELEALAASGDYDAITVDAGPLAQFLDLPPALDAAARWLDRLFAPRQATVFDPFVRVFAGDYASAGEDVLDRGRELLGRLARLRDLLTDADTTSVRLALSPGAAAPPLARDAVTALSLFSWPVDAVVVNRLLPGEVSDPFFAPIRGEQEASAGVLVSSVAPLPVLRLALQQSSVRGTPALLSLAGQLYAGIGPLDVLHRGRSHSFGQEDGAFVLNLALPLAKSEDLDLEQTEEGVAVHLNGRRCLLPLPAEARGHDRASWAFEDGVLKVIFER